MKQLTPQLCIDRTVFSQTVYTPPMLVRCRASVGLRRRRWSNIKTALAQCVVEYLVISLVDDINAVSLYSIGCCRPTRDCPTHARFVDEWSFKHVLEKKKFVCDISGKKLFVFDQGEKKCFVFCLEGNK